ncbi:MAG: hypothetical protein K2X77_13040 [Candidatus Obscuribacterales bacterium]|nr:hypothetical protein [Candidatus Obscuribacterales bacterium]
MKSVRRDRKGHCFIEMACGGIMLVPLMLFGLDVLTISLSCSINDHLAKEAARVAANQLSGGAARSAASKVVDRLRKSPIITNANVNKFEYDNKNRVAVQTELSVRMPAPFPFFEGTKIYARAVEPIVGHPVEYAEQMD